MGPSDYSQSKEDLVFEFYGIAISFSTMLHTQNMSLGVEQEVYNVFYRLRTFELSGLPVTHHL